MIRQCGECRYLHRTSPEQVFLKCEFWSATPVPKQAQRAYGQGYVVTHCHMQPWATACPFFEEREVGCGAA